MKKDVMLFCPNVNEVEINSEEALRYMGVRGKNRDEILCGELEEVKARVLKAVCYRACYIKLDVKSVADDKIIIGPFCVSSRSFARNLYGCSEAYLFAATVGSDVDRLIARLSVSSAARGLMADALCSAAIEGFCDLLNARLAEGLSTRARFSPGYGDMSLEYQKDFISVLDAGKNIGLALTQSLMLTPTKSVTALIGIQNEK